LFISQLHKHEKNAKKSPEEYKKMNSKNITESGRSMIEMLGVLVIVGVLSVIGIAGYRQAMNSYRAKETIHRIASRAIAVSEQRLIGLDGSLNSFNPSDGSYLIPAEGLTLATGNSSEFQITVANIPQDVCEKILASNWNIVTISSDCSSFKFFNNLEKRSASSNTPELQPQQPQQEEQSNQTAQKEACLEAQKIWCDDGCHDAGYTCTCPQQNNEYGTFGKDGETCCLNGYAEAWGNYNYPDIENCGCPSDANGNGHLGSDNQTCCNAVNKVWATWSYTGYNFSICGCPADSFGIGHLGQDNTTCCSTKNYAWANNEYHSYNAACGCPDGGELKGPEGDQVCCKDENAWSNGSYGDTNNPRCKNGGSEATIECPEDGLGGPVGYVGKDHQTCCNSYGRKWTRWSYDTFDLSICDCPEEGGEKGELRGTSENPVCCKGGRSWNGNWYGGNDSLCN